MKTEIMKIRTIKAEELLKLLKIDTTKEELKHINNMNLNNDVEIKTKMKEWDKQTHIQNHNYTIY